HQPHAAHPPHVAHTISSSRALISSHSRPSQASPTRQPWRGRWAVIRVASSSMTAHYVRQSLRPPRYRLRRYVMTCLLLGAFAANAAAQTPLTWDQVRARFEASNPTVRAGQIGIEESRASEITAYLRPNPQMSVSVDQFPLVGDLAPDPSKNLIGVAAFSY